MTMTDHILSADTQAILLLCGSLGKPRSSAAPLTQGEYNQLATWLQMHQLRPADLLQPDVLRAAQHNDPRLPLGERVQTLLSRGAALALTVERWTNQGLWIVSRSDAHYPQRLKSRLGRLAPPLLYGVGTIALLDSGGLAIVGSRDADEEAVAFTRAVVVRCVEQGLPIVSGGARGIDNEAMLTALDRGGYVIGMLADSLARSAVSGKYRNALREERLVLASPYDPGAGFNVGNAMNRNKMIYGLSDFALVISATLAKGGTWSGAVENLDQQWVPLFVRAADLPGNQGLVKKGAYPIDGRILERPVTIAAWAAGQPHMTTTELPLDTLAMQEVGVTREREQAVSEPPTADTPVVSIPQTDGKPGLPTEPEQDFFLLVWPDIERALVEPRTDTDIAAQFQIEVKQARILLKRAVAEGRARKLSKPVRYVATPLAARNLSLFDP